jgi:5-methylcytosine-specific restriction endonuclease McrA
MINWKRALSLFFTERAEVVEHHHDIEIRSPNDSIKLPKVMRLFCKIGDINVVKFNRLNVFYRDGFICQYCHTKFRSEELTLDHVYPKSKGGETNWENIVTACAPCNTRKADLLPHQCDMSPLKRPKEPRWIALFLLKLNQSEKIVWKDWFYLKES